MANFAALKDQDFVNIGPRISETTRDCLARLWPTANAGAEWILGSFPNLYERTLVELKGHFVKEELVLVLDIADLIVFFPEMAGQMLLHCLMDPLTLPVLRANCDDTIDFDHLEQKVRSLRHYQRTVLEIWAQAYRLVSGTVSRADYVAKVLP